MNDQFLYHLREEPDPLFADQLMQRFQFETTRSIFSMRWARKRALAAGVLGVLLLMLGALFTFSPSARALLQTTTEEIAGRFFTVMDIYPYKNQEVTVIIEPKILTVDQALAQSNYSIHLPTYLPAGYWLREDKVMAYPPLSDELGPTFHFTWQGDRESIGMKVCVHCSWKHGEIIAPGMVEEIELENGRHAILLRGGWYENERRWKSDIALTLEWMQDNQIYSLTAPGNFPVEELMAMASSIQSD